MRQYCIPELQVMFVILQQFLLKTKRHFSDAGYIHTRKHISKKTFCIEKKHLCKYGT